MGRKFRIRYAKQPKAAPRQTERVTAKLGGPHDLERFSLELQKLIARLQELNAQGVGNCALYFTPLNGSGEPIALKDEQGRAVEIL